jgi:hypothetical protein
MPHFLEGVNDSCHLSNENLIYQPQIKNNKEIDERFLIELTTVNDLGLILCYIDHTTVAASPHP